MGRLSMNELTTYSWSFEEDVHRYAAAGIEAIGVWLAKLTDYGVDKGAELLAERQMAVSRLLWAGGFTGSDGRSFQESVEDARETLKSAAAIGAPCVIVYSGARGAHTRNHARRLFRTALEQLLPAAEKCGVSLAIEPMHPGCAADWTLLTSLEEVWELLGELPSPRLQVAYDTYHLPELPDPELLAAIASRIAIVQLGDARQPPDGEQNRCPLGEGRIPLAGIVAALQSCGYDGDYEVELLGEDREAATYSDLLQGSQDALRRLGATQ